MLASAYDDSDASFYLQVAQKKPFKKLNQHVISHALINAHIIYLYTKIVVFSVVNIFNKTRYHEQTLQDAYDKAIGFVPIRTYKTTHPMAKSYHRSVRLEQQVVSMLKPEDENAMKQNRYWKRNPNTVASSGVARSRDAYTTIPLTHPTPKIQTDPHSGRHDVLTTAVDHLFKYELDPVLFAHALKEFQESVHRDIVDTYQARIAIGCVYALLGQQLWWKLAPPKSYPLEIKTLTFDLDFQQTMGTYSWEHLRAKVPELHGGAELVLLTDETATKSSTSCVSFLKYWADIVTHEVLRMDLARHHGGGHRSNGIQFTWESFARRSAFVTSTTRKEHKVGWFHIPTNGGHSDACHFSMKPTGAVDVGATKDLMFKCILTITAFLNGYWKDNSYDENTEDDFLTNKDARGNHPWRVYGGLTMPILLPMLYAVVTQQDVTIAIQTFGGKRSGMSYQVTDFQRLRNQPRNVGHECFSSIWHNTHSRIIFITHRLIRNMVKAAVMYKNSVHMEDGIGTTVKGAITDDLGNEQRAFVVFGESASKPKLVNDFMDLDEVEVDDTEQQDEKDEVDDEYEDDQPVEEIGEDYNEVADKNNSAKSRNIFYPFSGMFCSKHVMHNLTAEEQTRLSQSLNLQSTMVNGQIYCPSVNNPTCPSAVSAFGIADITSKEGIMNTQTAIDNSKAYFGFIHENIFSKFVDIPSRYPLGRMEVRWLQENQKPDALKEAFADLATIVAKDVRGYPADTYWQLSMFSVLALEGMQTARFRLQSQLHHADVYKEWIELLFEIRAHAYTMLSGRANAGSHFMFSAKDQQCGHRAIYSMLHSEFNKYLANNGTDVLMMRLLRSIIAHNKLPDTAEQLLGMHAHMHAQVLGLERHLMSPSRLKLQTSMLKLMDRLADKPACRYCRHCYLLFPPKQPSKDLESVIEGLYREHGCKNPERTYGCFGSRSYVDYTSSRDYRQWLVKEIDSLDECQLQLLRLVYHAKPSHLLMVGGAGKGKSKLLNIMRHVLVQRDGFEAVVAESMLKANAIKHNATTINSYYRLPVDNEHLRQLVDPSKEGLARQHVEREYNDPKRNTMRRVRCVLYDEVSSMSAPVHDFVHRIHSALLPDVLSAFGGIKTVLAGDPLQNPPFKGQVPFYVAPLCLRNYLVALMMDPESNHRFGDHGEWHRLLNMMRTLDLKLMKDVEHYHAMIGGVLSGYGHNLLPIEHRNRYADPKTGKLIAIIDCANVIVINEMRKKCFRESNQQSAYQQHAWQIQEGYLVEERIQPLIHTLKGLQTQVANGDVDTHHIMAYFQSFVGKFCEQDMYDKRIIVTETKQIKAYELMLNAMMDVKYDKRAIDQWYRKRAQDDYVLVDETQVPSSVKRALMNTMVSTHNLHDVVNLKPTSTRTISSNEAGVYLVKGMRVTILSDFEDNGCTHLAVHPLDVTGQGLHYQNMVMERTEGVSLDQSGMFKLVRKQYPLMNGCAATAGSIAGLTLTTDVVLDNTRTIQGGNFTIFNSRCTKPENVFIRHRLVPVKQGLEGTVDKNNAVYGVYFDMTADKTALLFNKKCQELWDGADKIAANHCVVVPATCLVECKQCWEFVCCCRHV